MKSSGSRFKRASSVRMTPSVRSRSAATSAAGVGTLLAGAALLLLLRAMFEATGSPVLHASKQSGIRVAATKSVSLFSRKCIA
jgi:hypothetical protein